MSARAAIVLGAVLVAAVAGAAMPARAAVRVEADEVIFTLRMPGAREVYLVGDFNQWNPTVEPMNPDGDRFEVGLFLVAGEYHYKFVVDGEWIVDPDNPGQPRGKGSPLKIVERGGGLILSTELAGTTAVARRAEAGVRYIGILRADEDDSDVVQRVDLTVAGRYDRLDARAVVATDDSSWTWSPASIDAYFDRGLARVRTGKLTMTGLENDSTWASDDPAALFGRAGLYGYDAGFRRHGVSAEAVASHTALRAFYGETTTRAPRAGARIAGADLADFAAGSAPDTSVYAVTPAFDGSDVLAAELALSFGKAGAGVVVRRESGVNPGVNAIVSRDSSQFAATVYATAERRAVSTAWLRHDDVLGARLRAAYGWGGTEARASGRGEYEGGLAAGIAASLATGEAALDLPLLDTRRAIVELAAGNETGTAALARWDHTRFDFDGVLGTSAAAVHRVTIALSRAWSGWVFAASDVYTDADYGDAPDALTIDGNELNPWLSMWDDFQVEDMAGLGFDRYQVIRVSARRDSARVAGGVELAAETEGLADGLVHASARADAEWHIRGPWYARADARVAWYDEVQPGAGGTFVTGYAEAGYRHGPVSLRAGFGFDPRVFDPVPSRYADIGRSEFLRTPLASGVRRSGAGRIFSQLVARERALEDAGVFKLECVIELP